MNEFQLLLILLMVAVYAEGSVLLESLSFPEKVIFLSLIISASSLILAFLWEKYSVYAIERRKRIEAIKELPQELTSHSSVAVHMGTDIDLRLNAYLPDAIRSRHVHILGATGSGKTESVILNFINQDVKRGLGAIILDAKGDTSFLNSLRTWIPAEKLKIFDLSDPKSLQYNPLKVGSPLEATQRLFSSLIWSEEYYKSKAFSTLQRVFEFHFASKSSNPTLLDLKYYLESPDSLAMASGNGGSKAILQNYQDVSGLRDQINSFCMGHLCEILSPEDEDGISLDHAKSGEVIYFRLQSLLSPQIVSSLGKLVINHLSYIAGTAHRTGETSTNRLPIYLDEFATFACPEFADLISKSRSAGMMLHFSHQSIGDLKEVSEGFLNRITDNSATKIVLRINDPDTAEFFARTFGTKQIQKVTHRIINATKIDSAELLGEGSQREAHQFRSSPDTFKTLPTGVGSVLIAHGNDTPHGASSVFKIKFPQLRKGENKMKNIITLALCISLGSGCATLNESMQLGAGLGAVTGASATYTSQKVAGQTPELGNVALGAGIGIGIGLLTSYLVHKNVEEKRTSFQSEKTDLYFGDLPPSPFIFPKNTPRKGVK